MNSARNSNGSSGRCFTSSRSPLRSTGTTVSSRYCLTGLPAPFAGDGDEFASGTGAGAASGSGSGSGSGAAAGSGSAVDVWGCELVSRGWWSRSRSASMGCSFWVVRTCGGFGFGGCGFLGGCGLLSGCGFLGGRGFLGGCGLLSGCGLLGGCCFLGGRGFLGGCGLLRFAGD